jgi:hypothetical protein
VEGNLNVLIMRKIISTISLFWLCALTVFSQKLYDLGHIPEIRITFDDKNWAQTLDSLKMAGTKERVAAMVEIDGKKYPGVGVRYKGNSSYKNPRSKGQLKLPFNLKADFTEKDQRFPGGFETLKLSNIFQDPSFLREVLSYEIARKYMPASRCNFAKVFVNGEYMGLYNNTEPVDEAFLEAAYGARKNTFFKCDPEWEEVKDLETDCPEGDKASLMYMGDDPRCYKGWYEQESKNDDDWQALIQFTKILNQHPEKIDSILNVDMTLWMHAFNNVLVNLDSYTGRLSHNYYLYKTPDGLFTPIVWDMNISFGGFRYDGEKQGVLTDEDMQTYSLFAHYKNKNPKRPLIVNLLANPLWRKIYVGHCRTIVLDNFANGEYLKLAEKIRSIIGEEVKNDPNKLYSYADFQKNLTKSVDIGYSTSIGIEELMKARTEYLLKHPLFNGKNPVVEKPDAKIAGTKISITTRVKNAEKVYLFFRYGKNEPFTMREMTGSGAAAGSTGSSWSLTLDKWKDLQYYIVAEGDRLAVCSPERASYEFYEVK